MFCDFTVAREGDPGACEEEKTAKVLGVVLSRLYDFGDDFEANKKRVKRKSVISESGAEPNPATSAAVSESEASSKPRASGLFETLKGGLRRKSANPKCSTMENDLTSSTKQRGQEPLVVKFFSQNEKKKLKGEAIQEKGSKPMTNIQDEEKVNGRVIHFEKARLEVHRFGITGYKKEKQRTFEQERAIMLGAMPPKKEYLNYRIYQDKIKQKNTEKQDTDGKELKSEFFKMKKKRKREPEERRTKKKKSSPNILPTKQLGKFKNGTLLLSGKDIKKIKSSKVMK
ncbi:uncharacterized protein C1orf131 homolog isoform X2 [Rhinatrema bivittatum]|uniref:uncharacterized protein C1orf131 homolog isoform X2 n=1 Tax=Rhinatrema bivittatum TaxID=194408 RepID=UPI00112E3336|nr:uncharacterized protein C1orf131 homolog isoform X2 [Rhinatrema bivittatum]